MSGRDRVPTGGFLQGTQHRVRLITIDNALERIDRTELRLSRIATSTVEKIVEANFPDIDPNRRYRYCELAEGYLRFAIFLCDNDSLIVQQGHLGTLLSDTKSYLGTLFGRDGPFEEADFTALMVISLVQRCGVMDNVFAGARTALWPGEARSQGSAGAPSSYAEDKRTCGSGWAVFLCHPNPGCDGVLPSGLV